MLYIHESNIKNKIANNYHGKGKEIEEFYKVHYLPMKAQVMELPFDLNSSLYTFEFAAEIFNNYYDKVLDFSKRNGINSQSKFESTFLEEISTYLFKDLNEIKSGQMGFFNKGIYAGIKLAANNTIEIIKKDVDFCIGKKAVITINNQVPINIILPVVAVEVKTYLDATMFGEVKSSSKAIRSASPGSKAYVLMGYKDLADEHIISARQNSTLTEMFALRAGKDFPIDAGTLFEYWKEISNAVKSVTEVTPITVPGRLLKE